MRQFKHFRISEISAVDRPAQKGAKMTIMKRDFTAEEREQAAKDGAAMPDGSFPIATTADLRNAVEAYGRAKDKAAAKKHIIRRARALGAVNALPEDWDVKKLADAIFKAEEGARTFAQVLDEAETQRRQWEAQEELWPLFNALQTTLGSIAQDAALDRGAKMGRVQQSVDEFLTAIGERWPEVEEELEKLFTPAGRSAGDHIGKKEPPMSDDVKKVADLEKQVADLTATLTNVLSLSKAERDHLDDLDEDEKEGFLRASAADRKAKMKKRAEDDPVVYKSADGMEFRKSDDTRLVEMAKRADKSDEVAKAEREKRETAELTKRASDEFGHLPGTPVQKAGILKAMGAMPEEARTTLEGILKAAEKMVANGFTMKGSLDGSTHDASSPEAQLEKKAKDIEKAENISYAKAYTKAAEQNPDLYEQISTPRATAP